MATLPPPHGQINARLIDPDPDNPPERYNNPDPELVANIEVQGILQPLLIVPGPLPGRYTVRAGNSRLGAAHQLNLRMVPYVMREDTSAAAGRQFRLAENGHRKGLAPMEEAIQFGKMRDEDGLTQSQIAAQTGFSQGRVSDRLALLELDAPSRQLVEAGVLSTGKALDAIRDVRATAKKKPKTKPAAAQVSVPAAPHHYLGAAHPLASAARGRCKAEHNRSGGLIGSTACGQCWEFVIRADERWQIEEGDPAPAEDAPEFDERAVEWAMQGTKLPLGPAERAEIARRKNGLVAASA